MNQNQAHELLTKILIEWDALDWEDGKPKVNKKLIAFWKTIDEYYSNITKG